MVKRSAGDLLFSISVDRGAGRSVTGQVYSAIKQLIVEGSLAAGKRLPSSRTIARELDISRTTAIAVLRKKAATRLPQMI